MTKWFVQICRIGNVKKLLIPLLLFLNLCYAQDQGEKVEAGTYQLDGQNEIEIGGVKYLQFDFKNANTISKLYEESNCIEPSSAFKNVALKSSYITANLASDVLALHELQKVKWDKAKHFYAGYIIGNISTGAFQLLVPKDTKNRQFKAFIGGSITSAVNGVAKEYRDSLGYGHVEANDAIATFMGGVTGSITFSLVDLKKKIK